MCAAGGGGGGGGRPDDVLVFVLDDDECGFSVNTPQTFHSCHRSVVCRITYSCCGPGNAYFMSIRQVSLPFIFWYFATY